MLFTRFKHSFRLLFLVLSTLIIVSCGSGDGEPSINDSAAGASSTAQLRLVFEDDFGGSITSSKLAAKSAVSVGNWRVETGYGSNSDGWGNNEWQLYTDSSDNLYVENGSLVIEARCDTAPNCNSRDGSITSARINTKDKLEVKYGVIQARIKVPDGQGMWPAFWMLGKNYPEQDWPDVGEIDIMEMFLLTSDNQTTHFATHWAGPDDAPTAAGCSGVRGSENPGTESENCLTASKTLDEPLGDEFRIYEVDWDKDRIIGKIDGVTYFTQAIDPATMEEFQEKFYLLLNIAVGGNAGGAPDATTVWPQRMLVDWVRVYEKPQATVGSLISETEKNIPFVRVFNSVEFGGNTAITDLNSTAVTPLEGTKVMEVNYATTKTGNPGATNALFGGAFFGFTRTDITDFNTFNISIDTSAFPGFADLTLEFKDSSDRLVQVPLSNYAPPTSTTGNWSTYAIPLSDFAGVDLSSMLFIGLLNPVNAEGELIAGTLYFDDIHFTTEACTAVGSVAFDSINYNPSTSVASVSIDDICAANTLATVKVTAGTDEIVVGVDLDAAGKGEASFGLINSQSVCSSSDELGYIALQTPFIATYTRTFINDDGAQQVNTATATAGIDENAPGTTIFGEKQFFYASDPGQVLTFAPDVNFAYSIFGSGSTLEGAFSDTTFDPVFAVTSGTGYDPVGGTHVAQLALIGGNDFSAFTGFAEGLESINFKIKDLPSDNTIDVEFGVLGGASDLVSVNVTSSEYATSLGDGWYEINIPMTEFPDAGVYNFMAFTAGIGTTDIFTFLITDIALVEPAGTAPAECETLILPPVAGSGTGDTGASGGEFSVSFDDPGVTYGFTGFGSPDTITSLANDPEKVTNLVAQTTKPVGAAVFAGVTVEPVPGITYPLSDTNNEMSIRIYAPGPGLVVRMKLEDSANSGNFVEADAVTTVDTGWETLTFTFTNVPAFTYDKLNLFFGFGSTGNGEVYTWDTIEFLGTVTPPAPGGELIINGTFETGDTSGWDLIPNAGTFTATMDQAASGSWSGNLVASVPDGGGPASFPVATQLGLALGTVAPGQTVNVSFDLCGTTSGAGGEFQSFLLSEVADIGGVEQPASATANLFGNITLTETWVNYQTSVTAGTDVTGGITLQLKSACGAVPGCGVNAYIDNVSVTLGTDVGNVSNAGGACAAPPPPVEPGPKTFSSTIYDEAFADGWGSTVCCGGATVTEVAATDTSFGQVVDIDYTAGNTIAGLINSAGVNMSAFETSGTFEFDALVTRAGTGDWKLKIEGATGAQFVEVPFTSSNEGLAPVVGTWQHYTFDIPTTLSAGSMDWATTKQLLFFSDFASGLGEIQVDNVKFKDSSLVVYENAYETGWASTVCCGGATVTEVAATDTAFKQVVEIDYTGGNTIAGFINSAGVNASAFETSGTFEFDALVTRAGTGDWKLKIEGATGAQFVEVPFTSSNEGLAPVVGTWQHYTFDIPTTLSAGSMDWATTKQLLFFSDFGSGLGSIQVDNVGFRAGSGGGGGGASGTATIDFETGGFGADFSWVTFENADNPPLQVISNPVSGGGNTSATVGAYTARAAGQPFAGVESGPGDFGLYVIDASTRYVKMWVYKSKISDVGMQLTVGAAALPAVRVPNTVINQWEQLTFDFIDLIGFGEWETGDITKLVIFPDWDETGRSENTIYIDNISFGPDP